MKILILIFSIMFVASCGKDDNGSTQSAESCTLKERYTGTWKTSKGARLIVEKDCYFLSDACGQRGSFEIKDEESKSFGYSGTVEVVTEDTPTKGLEDYCVPTGGATCVYSLAVTETPNILVFGCAKPTIFFKE